MLITETRKGESKLKDVKTRPSERTPRILLGAARAPKELAKKSIIEAKEKAKDVAQRQQRKRLQKPSPPLSSGSSQRSRRLSLLSQRAVLQSFLQAIWRTRTVPF